MAEVRVVAVDIVAGRLSSPVFLEGLRAVEWFAALESWRDEVAVG
ncbi:MAG: hypothetical protein ACYC5Q_10105 [Thermoleophilia bacterium]